VKPAGIGFAALFAILAAHTLTETARDALFLATLPPTRLPWAYLLIAMATLALTEIRRRLAPETGGPSFLAGTLCASALVSLGFWLVTVSRAPAVLFALYLWPALFSTVVMIEFWRLVSDVHTITEAKRAFGTISAGATAGALAGSAVATAMTAAFDVRHLLVAAAGAMLAAAVPVASMGPGGKDEAERGRAESQARHNVVELVSSHPYVVRLLGVLLMTTIGVTLADYVFKSVAARHVGPEALGSFFARVALALSVAALAVQAVATRPLVQRVGVLRLAALLPVTLAATGSLVAAGMGLLGVLAMRIGDGTLRHSVHRTAAELLYVPLSPRMRAEIKPLVDVVGHRGGQVIGSAMILLALALGADDRWLAGAVAAAAGGALAVTAGMRAPYLNLFRRVLDHDATETRLAYPALDLMSLQSLVSALNSEDDRLVVAALELLEAQGQANLVPALILFHPSPAVVRAALNLLTRNGRTDFAWIADRLWRESADAEIRAAALRALTTRRADRVVLENAMGDPDAIVRATAMVGLVAGGWLDAGDAAARLTAVSGDGAVEQLAVATAIARQPSPVFSPLLGWLAGSSDVRVRAETARAMGRVADPTSCPSCVTCWSIAPPVRRPGTPSWP
jgi:AAA family ATP:ADP antiporter